MLIKKPGARMIKTGLALFLAMLISSLRPKGLPFYSGIAAIICMQQDLSSTFIKGVNRAIGTIIGGLTGLVYLLIVDGMGLPKVVNIFFLSLIVIGLIWILASFEKHLAITIAGIVFLSVTVNHANDAAGPVLFAVSRIIDTIIGIFAAIFVNWADFEFRKRYRHRKDSKNKKTRT